MTGSRSRRSTGRSNWASISTTRADVYGPYTNEELLGGWLKGKRDRVFLATKFANIRDASGQFVGISGKPEYVRSACDASLRRLGIDTIDLYYQHRVDFDTPIEETVGAMADLVKAGKVRYLGLSEASAETLERACKVHPIAALQSEYSLWTRDVETQGNLAAARRLGVALVPYSPLGRGFLSGRVERAGGHSGRRPAARHAAFQGENFDANMRLVEALKAMADAARRDAGATGTGLGAGAGQDIVPIPRDEAAQVSGREYRGGGDRTQPGGSAGDSARRFRRV